MATSAFGKAFREARASGDKDFTFNGKKYNTNLASDPTRGEARNKAEQDTADTVDYGAVLQSRETGRTRGGPSYDSAGKPSNAGPDVLSSNYSRKTRTGATAQMLMDNAKKPMSKEDYVQSREQYKTAQDESEPSTFRKGGAVKKYAAGGSVSSRADGIAQRGKTRGRMC
jgi:hypothetical protein